ncbi:MAG: amino acid ABC transporter permease [Deltaproteobacteria bacterium]|nr:amino acid ABC transporter permease [Deltaproteobacteria bacterium]
MRRPKTRITPTDVVLSLLLLAAFIFILYRIKAGLHYKWNWGAIPQYLFRYDPERGEWVSNVLIQGLLTTIRLSLWGTLLAALIGIIMGLCRVSGSLFNRIIGRTYVELIRNLPPLVLIFIFYYFISAHITVSLGVEEFIASCSEEFRSFTALFFAPPHLFSPFLSALVTLALFEGAYITEIVRAGVQSIEKGQWEASCALGLSYWQQMRYIILPLAVQRILPPLAGQFISTIKDSAIVSVISIQELTFQGMELMSATYLTFEVWITITALYLLLTFSLSLALSRVEITLRRSEA